MLSWLVRLILAVSAVIAGWFIADDAANFGIIQLVVALFLITICIAVAAFWPNLVAMFRGSGGPEGSKKK